MRQETKEMFNIVSALNKKKKQWSYLTSIEYMLQSNLYMDSVYSDANRVARYISKKCRILDFGTGSGVFAIALRSLNKNIKIFALDTYKDESQKDPNFKDTSKQQALLWEKLGKEYKIKFSHYDGKKIPFPTQSFDIITAYAVIEHIHPNKWSDVIAELSRVLKKNGLLFLFKTPRKLAIIEYAGGALGIGRHELLFSDGEVKKAFSLDGFELLENWKSNMVFEFPGKVTNLLYLPLKMLDFLLYLSPFRIFAHHNNFIFKKR